jgi:glucokinase
MSSQILAGIDIGGTKCAVVLAEVNDTVEDGAATAGAAPVRIMGKRRFPTPPTPEATMARFVDELAGLLAEHDVSADAAGDGLTLAAIGISCGGPLDSRHGLILSPPNLPGWDCVDVLTPFTAAFGVPVAAQNDANACALAEWRWGAGRGCQNVIFLTFGTGMGAGLILDGRLYAGTNDMAGEVGHLRLAEDGPVGYGKAGSFEGFCSGGGIARLARTMAAERIAAGQPPAFCPTGAALPTVTAETVGRAAAAGDPLAREVFTVVGRQLGRGLALLVDILNPERIVIGSIYGRQHALLEPVTLASLATEAIPRSLSVCKIVPAGLGESVGDLASLGVALYALD